MSLFRTRLARVRLASALFLFSLAALGLAAAGWKGLVIIAGVMAVVFILTYGVLAFLKWMDQGDDE